MIKKSIDPIGKLFDLRFKSHPWHGIDIGPDAPKQLTCFIEMVATDTVKYEIDKASGYLTVDRPQKYSNILPALYGFLPQTYCGEKVGKKSAAMTGRTDVVGDGDPLDVCVLTEKEIAHNSILVQAHPIGGFRMIDGDEADDKIICTLHGDAVYETYNDISECPESIVNRLKHYFLTYKDMPGAPITCEITHIYGREEAEQIVELAMEDYRKHVEHLLFR